MFSFLLVLALANNVFSQLNDDMSSMLPKLTTGLQEKCTKNADSSSTAEIIMLAQQIMECANQNISNDISANSHCARYAASFIKCLERLAEASKKCLDADEKYFPDFILRGQKRILDKSCTTDYQISLNIQRSWIFNDSMNKLAESKCKTPFLQLMNTEFASTCLPKSKLLENIDKGVFSLKKSIVCSHLQSVNTFMVNVVKTNCEADPNDLKVLSVGFEEYQAECKTNSAAAKVTSLFTTLGFIILGVISPK